MAKEKHYLLKRNYPYKHREDTLELYGKKLIIEINEDWERCPSIEVVIGEGFVMEPDSSDQYTKIKRLIPDIFDSYFHDTIKYLSRNFPEKAEYFLHGSSRTFQLYTYTESKCLFIDINNEISSFYCKISLSNGIRSRNTARKKL